MARGRRGRGGYQRPSSPAAASPPGALSQRTDGGPSAGSYQYSGLPYGDNQAANSMASGAPMGQPQGGGGRPQGGGRRPVGPNGVFGPSDRPQEPMTAGIDWGSGPGGPPQVLDEDPYLLAKALLQANPENEALARIVARLARG